MSVSNRCALLVFNKSPSNNSVFAYRCGAYGRNGRRVRPRVRWVARVGVGVGAWVWVWTMRLGFSGSVMGVGVDDEVRVFGFRCGCGYRWWAR